MKGFMKMITMILEKFFKSHVKPSTNTTGLDKLSEFLKSAKNYDVGPSKYYGY